jgi:hypothetical protein
MLVKLTAGVNVHQHFTRIFFGGTSFLYFEFGFEQTFVRKIRVKTLMKLTAGVFKEGWVVAPCLRRLRKKCRESPKKCKKAKASKVIFRRILKV